jgi:hypothetical protein
LAFLSRSYEQFEIPKEKAYLYKYFKTPVQELFVKYMHVFNDHRNFMPHTGYRCEDRWLRVLHTRLIKLEALHAQAKKDLDFELLRIIERGEYDAEWVREYNEDFM